jgi:hypothetical protein
MVEHSATEEINLDDVWRLLAATATKLDQLYAALDKPAVHVALSSPTTQRVMDHPFFGMTSGSEGVSETMAHLRGDRYAR